MPLVRLRARLTARLTATCAVLAALALTACDAGTVRDLLTGAPGGGATLYLEAGIDDTRSYDGRTACRASLRRMLAEAAPGDVILVRRIADDSNAPAELVVDLELPAAGGAENPFAPTARDELERRRAERDSLRDAAVAALARLDAMPEPEVTDIAGWLVAVSGSVRRAPAGSVPVVVACSDWIDTRHKTIPRVELADAHVVFLHFTFRDEPDRALDRQAEWRAALIERGARSVEFYPSGQTPSLDWLRGLGGTGEEDVAALMDGAGAGDDHGDGRGP